MDNIVTMNTFTDVLKKNIDEILATTTVPGAVLAVQKVLVQNNLDETKVGRQLTRELLSSLSHTDAVQKVFKYMM